MILDWIFPNRCLNCSQIIGSEETVCSLCFDKIHFTHFDFYGNNNLKERCKTLFPVENAFALMQFKENNLSRKIIHELKYKGREKIGKDLAEWTNQQIHFRENKPSLIIPIPLHPKKLKIRGYNQLHLFVETLSKLAEIPFNHSILIRKKHQKAQAQKKFHDREKAENLFGLTTTITNQHILLIDDVFTTGNTITSAAWEILKSGNNKISILVLALDE